MGKKKNARIAERVTIPGDLLVEIIKLVKSGEITTSQGRQIFREEVERLTVYKEQKAG